MKRFRRAAVVISIPAAMLGVAPSANAKIMVGKSIAGVSLGDSKASVERHFGKGKLCDSTSCLYGGAFDGRITFNRHGHVISMFTGSCSQATSKGIHAIGHCRHGSSLAAIKKAYPTAKCTTLAHSGGFSSCDLRTRLNHRKVRTDFLIKSSAAGVGEISVAYA